VVLVTHYQRLLDYIVPDYVHVLSGGRILKSGDRSLALTGQLFALAEGEGQEKWARASSYSARVGRSP